jgi:hypothetical protein
LLLQIASLPIDCGGSTDTCHRANHCTLVSIRASRRKLDLPALRYDLIGLTDFLHVIATRQTGATGFFQLFAE